MAALATTLAACSKKASEQPQRVATAAAAEPQTAGQQTPQVSEPMPVPKGAAPGSEETLNALTQAVRRYAVEHRSKPASLSQVISAGYVRELPPAPAGKKYEIDRDTTRVVLVKQ